MCTDWRTVKAGDVIREFDETITYVLRVDEIKRNTPRQIQNEIKITARSYQHYFESKATPGAGYSFPTDKDGVGVNDKWKERIEELKNDPNYDDRGIEWYDNTWREPAVIRCDCGSEVELHMIMTNTCDKCGTDYNLSGQRLAPRSQWGWDTGESLDDILSADHDINEPSWMWDND